MECKFVVGQKVTPLTGVWVQHGTNRLDPDAAPPQLDAIYTIRAIELCLGLVGLRFIELQNPMKQYDQGYMEALYLASEFKPVDERKTDISIFTELLTPAGQKKRIREDAHV